MKATNYRKKVLYLMAQAGRPVEEIVTETNYSLSYVKQILGYIGPLVNPEVYKVRGRGAPLKGGKGSRLSPENQARREEMRRLRFEEKWPIRKIGEHYGISRERVRQIIGNSGAKCGGFNYRPALGDDQDLEWVQKTLGKTNAELATELGLSEITIGRYRHMYRHAVEPGCALGVGAKLEEWVSDRLWRKGIANKLMPVNHPFDILAGGNIRIDVKSTSSIRVPSNDRMVNPQYSFRVRKNRRDKADFYVLVIAETEDVFIVPASVVPASQECIVFAWPTERPEIAKWQNYHDAWDLIETALETAS